MAVRFTYLRKRMPQAPRGEPDEYQQQLSAALHESERDTHRAIGELDTPPVLSVALITSNQSLSLTTLTPVHFNSSVIDTHSWWNSATYTYTPLEPGFYRCAWAVRFVDTAAFATSTVGYAQLNTTHITIQPGNGVSTDILCTGSTVIECNGSTDTIKLNAYISAGTAPVVYATTSPYSSWLTIDYIGRRAKTYG